MNARLALPSLAVAVAVGVVGSAAGSAGAVPRAPITAPAPVPTRPTDEVCDAWAVAQELCEAVPTLLAGRYACSASTDVAASRGTHPAFPGLVLWNVDSYSFHSCPNRSGDLVRVVGALEAMFNGEVVAAEVCGDLASCSTHRNNPVIGYQYAVAVAVATTTTYADVSGTATAMEYFVWT